MSNPPAQPDRVRAADAARSEVRRSVFALARRAGAQLISRPIFRGAQAQVRDVEPLAGARLARDLELSARATVREYISAAREAGHSWHDIGTAMNLRPNGDAQQAGDTVADAAYTYAAGHPGSENARRYGRSITWTCRSCDQIIGDLGVIAGPAFDERGHTDNCRRHIKAIDAWDTEWEEREDQRDAAQWEADQWEAGQ